MSNNALLTMMMMDDDDDRVEEVVVDHCIFPRSRRKKFRHDQALMCINRDYLGPERLMDDKQFEVMLRITPAWFQRLFEDVRNSGIPYYLNRVDALGEEGASMEARLMLPIRTLAYGVAPHTFRDYYQMSTTMARQACDEFDIMMKQLYERE
jgi:hypothetical protein